MIFDYWDILLLLVITVQSTFLAYIYHPQWKAFMLSLPFPFTVAVLAVGKPVNVTNMTGLILLLLFSHCVRILYNNFKINIFMAIVFAAMLYCLLGWGISISLPRNPMTFWGSAVLVIMIAVGNLAVQPHKNESGQKSLMPIWAKLLVILCIVMLLITMKNILSGFITVFPMVGVIAAYEARKALWTVSRQIPVVMLTLGPMIMAIYIFQSAYGRYWSLVIGWIVFLALFIPYSYWATLHFAGANLNGSKSGDLYRTIHGSVRKIPVPERTVTLSGCNVIHIDVTHWTLT